MRPGLPRDLDSTRAALEKLIQAIGVSDGPEREYLESRWLDQVLWMERRAGRAQNWHYVLRLTTIVGGVSVPTAVSLAARAHGGVRNWFDWGAIVVGLIVAMSAAVEEFFHYGERWRHYRQTAEWLKAEGWNLVMRSGRVYAGQNESHALTQFVARVERILQRDVEGYLRAIAQERPPEGDGESASALPRTDASPAAGGNTHPD